MANSMNGEAAFVITDMTVGFMRNPLGIETDSVFFGWKMDSDLIGEMQAAYRIWVLTDGGLSVWDSGKQAAAVSTGIACEGRLAERTRYRLAGLEKYALYADEGRCSCSHISDGEEAGGREGMQGKAVYYGAGGVSGLYQRQAGGGDTG